MKKDTLEKLIKLQADRIEYLHSRVQSLLRQKLSEKEYQTRYNRIHATERKIKSLLKTKTK